MNDNQPGDNDLWSLLAQPVNGYCCQDAYASGRRAEPWLHTSGCPNRCSTSVPVPDAARRGLVAGYPCALTRHHVGDHWLHPRYRPQGEEAA